MAKKTKEQNLELKYSGILNSSKTVYLHYGIGDNWEELSECKMRKLKNYYKTEITIPTNAQLNFCFRDSNNNWDNNNGQNYSYDSHSDVSYENVQISIYTPKKSK